MGDKKDTMEDQTSSTKQDLRVLIHISKKEKQETVSTDDKQAIRNLPW